MYRNLGDYLREKAPGLYGKFKVYSKARGIPMGECLESVLESHLPKGRLEALRQEFDDLGDAGAELPGDLKHKLTEFMGIDGVQAALRDYKAVNEDAITDEERRRLMLSLAKSISAAIKTEKGEDIPPSKLSYFLRSLNLGVMVRKGGAGVPPEDDGMAYVRVFNDDAELGAKLLQRYMKKKVMLSNSPQEARRKLGVMGEKIRRAFEHE
jgi:hypothetical protein